MVSLLAPEGLDGTGIPGSSDRYLKMSAKIMVGLFFCVKRHNILHTKGRSWYILSFPFGEWGWMAYFQGLRTFDVSFRECIFSLGGIPSLGVGGILDFLSVFF